MGRPALLLLSAVFAALPGRRADAHLLQGSHAYYAIIYDDGIEVRTDFPPKSAVKENGGPLTSKQRQALRDPGRPGYRAQLIDLAGARFVTLYLEEPGAEVGPGGKPLARNYPPVYCLVYRNRLRSRSIALFQVAPGPTRTYLIGYEPGQGIGIHLPPKVRVKTILVHSYVPDLSGRFRR